MTEIDKLKSAKSLHDKGLFEESKRILLNMNIENISYEEIIYKLLASCFFNTDNYIKTIEYAEKVLVIDNSNELASLTKYVACVKLGNFNEAFKEIFSYLNNYPAILYKDTLLELKADILSGFINDNSIINAINYLAEKNGILDNRSN
jgi:tetratricopeptide (TPR) repeat protein